MKEHTHRSGHYPSGGRVVDGQGNTPDHSIVAEGNMALPGGVEGIIRSTHLLGKNKIKHRL